HCLRWRIVVCGRQKDDRQMGCFRVFPESTADLKAIDIRQIHIQDNQVRTLVDEGQQILTAVGTLNPVAEVPESAFERIHVRDVIVDSGYGVLNYPCVFAGWRSHVFLVRMDKLKHRLCSSGKGRVRVDRYAAALLWGLEFC